MTLEGNPETGAAEAAGRGPMRLHRSWSSSFADRSVVITGAAAGIGAATARRLAGPGPILHLVDRDSSRAQGLAAEVEAVGGTAFVASLDLTDQSEVVRFAHSLDLQERPAVLINCASGMSRMSLAEVDYSEWRSQYDVNVVAAANLAKGLTPHFSAFGGSVVNVSSEAAYRARAGAIAYDCAKAAVTALTRSMAAELHAYGVRVNCVAPGWTITERHVGYGPDSTTIRARLEGATSPAIAQRPAVPDEIAGAICFLASDDASYVNATTLHVDGGLSIH